MRLTVERQQISHVNIDIPPELLANIFRQLVSPGELRFSRHEYFLEMPDFRGASTADIRKLRLVCRAFNFAASPFLIPTVFLSSSQRDMDVLTAISEHPVFSKHVNELVYDCRMFDQALTTDKHSYVEELRRLPLYAFGEETLLTKALAKESFQAYARFYQQQEECREARLDMQCLIDAFPKMPQLSHVCVRGRSRTRFIPLNRNLVHRPDRRVTELTMIPPQARVLWRRDDRTRAHNEACHRGILDFLTTVSRANIARQLRSLSVGHPTDQEELKLSSELFGPEVESVGRCGRLFENLKRIQLTIRIGDDQDDAWVVVQNQNNLDNHLGCQAKLRWALGFARGLEYLSLNFRCASRRPGYDVQLNHILDKLSFPRLYGLKLTSVRCMQSTVLDFLQRHQGVLKKLSLNDVVLMDGTWITFIDKLKEMNLQLGTCELGLRHRPELDYGHPRYIPTGAVVEYLNGGGQHPLEDVTADDLVSPDAEVPDAV